MGRTLSFATVVRKYQVEITRTAHLGTDETAKHTVQACESLRSAVSAGWPNASISWAFSWQALISMEPNYVAIRRLVAGYVGSLGDEMTFVPSGYFAPMYNLPNQTNADIHDALQLISATVGGGYRPRAIIGGYLSSRTLQHLARVEDIHVAQANIFSQFAIDYGDGDGGSPYPFYPSTEHYLKPAQTAADLIDLVNLDGWTVDLLACRRVGFAGGFNSRLGVGPIETVGHYGPIVGRAEIMAATAAHFTTGFALNGFGYVTSVWESETSRIRTHAPGTA